MIVSASRRTDIPALYGGWFLRRLRAGFCEVPNPFRPSQRTRVSLAPEDVTAVVFWTRNAGPFRPVLPELDGRGIPYVFLWTVLDNPRAIDPCTPPAPLAVRRFRELADRIGPDRVTWRYDPVIWSDRTDLDFHRRAFERIAGRLAGATRRCVVSFLDVYRKAGARLNALRALGIGVREPDPAETIALVRHMADCAAACGMRIQSCCEEHDLAAGGVPPGGCIDAEWLRQAVGIAPEPKRDPHQRPLCRCLPSRDIGVYDTCVLGCAYCYATRSFSVARARYRAHDPAAVSLG